MDWMREIPEPLIQAQLSLETVEGFTFLDTLKWNDQAKKWTIRFRFSPKEDDGGSLNNSEWYLVIEESYPLGRIDVYPAKHNGIIDTYPHQQYNQEGDSNLPWRDGNICTNTQMKVIGRHGYDVEPYAPEDRLLWHCQRAIEWVRCAKNNTLVIPGEPFELPHIPPFCKGTERFLFSERNLDISPWSYASDTLGLARCFNLKTNEKTWHAEYFWGERSNEICHVAWGIHVTRYRETTWQGAWLRLPTIPTVKPYRFPETWGELRQVLTEKGITLKEKFRSIAKQLRDGELHFLLIGFPIPEIYEGSNAAMHWIALELPRLSCGREYPNGFRPNDQGYIENDMRTRFRRDKQLTYMTTENWHSNQIQNRGRYPEPLRSSRVAVVGCGALGATLAEMLVRGGVHLMTLFDGERVTIGNLSRHTLILSDVNCEKANKLAQRLNSSNPHAEVVPIASKLTFSNESVIARLHGHDLIVDCTGDDEFLHLLSKVTFTRPVHFFSASIGFRAKRLFLFHAIGTEFPVEDFFTGISPWIEAEEEEFSGYTFPREGLGCYHPVFPARCDDIWLWGSIAVKKMSMLISSETINPVLYVFEQNDEGTVSVRREIEELRHE